jgi:hypothetical protein
VRGASSSSHAARRRLTEPLRFRLCVEAGMGANTLRFTAGEAPLLRCERARALDQLSNEPCGSQQLRSGMSKPTRVFESSSPNLVDRLIFPRSARPYPAMLLPTSTLTRWLHRSAVLVAWITDIRENGRCTLSEQPTNATARTKPRGCPRPTFTRSSG